MLEPILEEENDNIDENPSDSIRVIKPDSKPIFQPRKSISVTYQTYQELLQCKHEFRENLGDHLSFNRIIHHLLSIHNEYKELKTQLQNMEQKNSELLNDERNFLRQVLITQNQQRVPVMMGAMSNVNLHTGQLGSNFTPPPPPPRIPHRKFPKKYIPMNTGNLKKDYVNEIKQIFTGDILKPSEVIETTQPKHQNTEISHFTEEFDIPPIESISSAKSFINMHEIESKV